MKQKKKNQIAYWLKIAVLGITLGFALQFVRAWTEPSQTPPAGNVGAPINTSGTAQTKAGAFSSSTSLTAPTIYANNALIVGGQGYVCWCYYIQGVNFQPGGFSSFWIDTYKECAGTGPIRVGTLSMTSVYAGDPTGNGGSGKSLCMP